MANSLSLWNLLLIIICLNKEIEGRPTTPVGTQLVTAGDRIVIQCTTEEENFPINWKYSYPGYSSPQYVYKDGRLINGFAEPGKCLVKVSTVRVEGRISKVSELIFLEVKVHDAGEYFCIDQSGEQTSVKLEVGDGLKDLAVVPRDTLVIQGENETTISCSSTYRENVWWKHKPVGSNDEKDVYLGDIVGFKNGYSSGGRHSINRNDSLGQYDLVIRNVQSSDAGTYICVDQSGIGRKAQAELIVLESTLGCQSNIYSFASSGILAENSCGINPDTVQMTCSAKYNGNIRPSLEWTNDKSKHLIAETHNDFVHPMVKSTLKVEASSRIKWESYMCRVTINSNNVNNYTVDGCNPNNDTVHTISITNWTTAYKTKTADESGVICNTSVFCKHSWMKQEADMTMKLFTESSVLNRTNSGKYICKAECNVHETPCIVYPMYVDFENYINAEWKQWHVVVSAIIPIVIIIIAIFVSGLVFWIRFRKKKNQHNNQFFMIFNSLSKMKLRSFTLFHDKLYVICNSSEVIYILPDHNPLNPIITALRIIGMTEPHDIVPCPRNNCLYVSDSICKCIWKIPLNLKDKEKQFITNIETPFTFSVMQTGEILIVSNENVISKYDENGDSMEKLDLELQGNDIKNIAVVNDREFLVSFGIQIGLFNKSRKLIGIYPKEQTPTNQIRHSLVPWHLLFSNSHYIFVADQGNEKVYVFNSALQYQSDIDMNTTVKDVQKVCYNEDKNELLVAVKTGVLVIKNFIAENNKQLPNTNGQSEEEDRLLNNNSETQELNKQLPNTNEHSKEEDRLLNNNSETQAGEFAV